MRILHVISNLQGGAGKAAVRLHEALLNRGINSHVICLYLDNRPIIKVSKISHDLSYFKRLLQKLGFFSSAEKQAIKKKLHAVNKYEFFSFCQSNIDITKHEQYKHADIINLHWVAGLLDFPSFFTKNRKPVIWSLSDMNPFTGGCHYSNDCTSYRYECHSCPQLKGTISDENAYKNLSLKVDSIKKMNFNLIIATPANWLHNCSMSSLLFKKFQHIIIPHPSDEIVYKSKNMIYCRNEMNIPTDKIVLLFSSGSLTNKRKGFSILSHALAILDNPSIHLLIIGNSDESISLPKKSYTVTGYIQDENQMSVAYNASDAILIPSIEDNLPLTLIDSMMCGVPAISFNNGGMQDYIRNEVNGIICDSISSKSLAETITLFISNKAKFKKQVIRSMAMKMFTKKDHAERYSKQYIKLLQSV